MKKMALLSLTMVLAQTTPVYSQTLAMHTNSQVTANADAPESVELIKPGKPKLILRGQKPKTDLPMVLSGRLEHSQHHPKVAHQKPPRKSTTRIGKVAKATPLKKNATAASSTVASGIEDEFFSPGLMLREDFGRFGSFMEMHRRHRARIENMMNSLMTDSFPQSDNCGCHEASRLFDKGKYNQAAVAWKKYAKQLQDSFHEETRNEATALVWEGYSYYKAKRFKEARIAWRKALGIYSRVAPNDENIAFVNQHLRLIRAQAGRLEPSSQS